MCACVCVCVCVCVCACVLVYMCVCVCVDKSDSISPSDHITHTEIAPLNQLMMDNHTDITFIEIQKCIIIIIDN